MIGRAMRRALQWRLLVVSAVLLLVAAAATLAPLARFLGELFDHSPRWRELTAGLDSSALAGIAKALSTPASSALATGLRTSLLLAVVFAPLIAGAALCVAAAEARPTLRALLSGAAGYYPRLLRMQLVAVVPLGIAGAIAALAYHWAGGVAERATSEAATHVSSRVALVTSLAAVFVAQLVVDAGRARLVAEPARRSALVALGAGVKLIVRRPVQVLTLGLASAGAAFAVAAVVLIVRNQLAQSGAGGIAFAFLVGQLAIAAITWGRAAKLCGLVELVRGLGTGGAAATLAAVTTAAPSPSRAAAPELSAAATTAAPAPSRAAAPELPDAVAPEAPGADAEAPGAPGAVGRGDSPAPIAES
jgi:hypothetical protein